MYPMMYSVLLCTADQSNVHASAHSCGLRVKNFYYVPELGVNRHYL